MTSIAFIFLAPGVADDKRHVVFDGRTIFRHEVADLSLQLPWTFMLCQMLPIARLVFSARGCGAFEHLVFYK